MGANVGERINQINQKSLRKEIPQLSIGDVIKMKIRVKEADKIRTHPFEGTVIKKKGSGLNETFTVRKISFGEGVERIFPAHSPVIESIQVVSKGVVKRAKLYYLRDRLGKGSKVEVDQEVRKEVPATAETSVSAS